MDIRTLTRDRFPSLLHHIADPPTKLFVQGPFPDEDHVFLAVVGSRKYSDYGARVTEKLIGGLTGYPVVVVSGLALGIDGLAHKSALRHGLTTIAVPGSGLDERVLYPQSHVGLAKDILKAGGCLLSEFEPDFKATQWSFPQRNRIMAGLSHAVLIIEATEKSGTLITARLAMEYNRDVLAVPGSIFSKSSEGAHGLIRDGATPITSTADLINALGLKEKEQSNNGILFSHLSAEEALIMELLAEPCTRDELIRESNLETKQANILLSTMELKGLICESFGKVQRV